MSKKHSAIFGFLILAFLLSSSNTPSQTKKESTIIGEIVDVASFLTSQAKQDTAAIRKSAAVGNALGIYDTKAKKLYLVGRTELNTSANEKLLPYVSVRVFVIGKVYSKAGVSIILINDIGRSIK